MPATIKLIVTDRHSRVSARLRDALGVTLPNTEIVESQSIDALERALATNPDATLVVLDLFMLDEKALSALIDLRARYPKIAMAIVSAGDSPTIVTDPVNTDRCAVRSKPASADPIGRLVQTLLGAELPPQQHCGEASVERYVQGRDPMRDISRLTPQQRRVLMSLSNGLSNKTIAQNLGVTEATVKAHITVILRKLGLECRTQAALLAQRLLGVQPTADDTAPADDALASCGRAIEPIVPDSVLGRARSWGLR